jgi:hypothetical protein
MIAMIGKSIARITVLLMLISLFVGVAEGSDLVIKILQPGANVNWGYDGGPIAFYYEANKPLSWVAYSIDEGVNVTVTRRGIMLPALTNGPHGIKLYANDTEGQVASSMTYYFSIFDSPLEPSPVPTTSLIMPTPTTVGLGSTDSSTLPNLELIIAAIVVAGVCLTLGLLLKRNHVVKR